MILLSCFCAALTNTTKKPERPSRAIAQKRGIEAVNKRLKDIIPPRCQSFISLLESYNLAVRATNKRSSFLTRYTLAGIPVKRHHFSHLVPKHTICDALSLYNVLLPLGINTQICPKIKDLSIIQPLCNKIDQMVDSIEDPTERAELQKRVAENKLKIQRSIFPNAIVPQKVSPEKARQQKIQLMQYVNEQLRRCYEEQENCYYNEEEQEDRNHYLAFAIAHNTGILCTQPEYSRHKADKTLASIYQYTLDEPIDSKTARQYKVNHPRFYNELINGKQSIDDVCDRTTDLLKELPPIISKLIDNDLHEALEIGYE